MTELDGPADRLVFPIGMLMGTFPDDAEPTGHHHEIRCGGRIHELSDRELAAWAFAHGPPDADPDGGGTTWTRTGLEQHLAGVGVDAAKSIVDGLLARGLLVEVAPDGDAAVAFARSHSVAPTMYGLGNSAEEPWLYSIGLLGQELIQVSRPVFELWAWGHVNGDLWRACTSFAELERAAGATEPEVSDPTRVLAGFLSALHGLLSVQVGYLDTIVDQR
jgi:hypothetical protein